VNAILEDLTKLPTKRLEKRLEELAREAFPCNAATVFGGSPAEGLIVALRVDSHNRGDVRDLARVVEDDAAVQASCGWSLLAPSKRHPLWRLLLRVSFERPASCVFTVEIDIRQHPEDPLRESLPLLLAADRFVFDFDGDLNPDLPLVWITAPAAKECVLDILTSSSV
jgi:hypothetical protein